MSRSFASLLICFLISWRAQSQGPQIEVKFSEPLAVYMYVEHLSSHKSDNAFKRQFQKSKYNTEKMKSLLAHYDTLTISYAYEYTEFPYASKLPGFTEFSIKKCLVNSANLKEFKRKATGIIPNANLLQLSAILYEFQSVYRELVYQPNKKQFEKQLKEITEYVKSKKISGYIDEALVFYKSYWDESIPFEVALYPLPDSDGFSAEAFNNTSVCALKTNMKDYNVMMSVMLHEVFHILYDEQPLQVKNHVWEWFSKNPSNCRTYAYLLLNEALATSLGNGYVFEALTGKIDKDDWYDRKYIHQMARKMYPLVKEYLKEKKSMDENFVNEYIKIYEENFKVWLTELDNLMCYRYVLSENTSDFDAVSQAYPYSSFFEYQDEISQNTIDALKSKPLTKMIVISKENEIKLNLVKKNFPELKDWKFKAKKDFLYSAFLSDKTHLIIVNVVNSPLSEQLKGQVKVRAVQ